MLPRKRPRMNTNFTHKIRNSLPRGYYVLKQRASARLARVRLGIPSPTDSHFHFWMVCASTWRFHRDNIGQARDELVALWNAEHPEDSMNCSRKIAPSTATMPKAGGAAPDSYEESLTSLLGITYIPTRNHLHSY